MEHSNAIAPTGALGLVVRRGARADTLPVERPPLAWRIRNARNYLHMLWEAIGLFVARAFSLVTITSELRLKVFKADGRIIDYGKVSVRKFTTAGAGFIVDAFQNSVEMEIMKYHALGTGTNAEANTDAALQTEITATHYTDSLRPTGSTEEGATANIYKTIATHTHATAGDAITEHGIVSTASGAVVLLDRHVFAAINLAVADSLVSTYSLTITAEA